jgi:hypothetical protein
MPLAMLSSPLGLQAQRPSLRRSPPRPQGLCPGKPIRHLDPYLPPPLPLCHLLSLYHSLIPFAHPPLPPRSFPFSPSLSHLPFITFSHPLQPIPLCCCPFPSPSLTHRPPPPPLFLQVAVRVPHPVCRGVRNSQRFPVCLPVQVAECGRVRLSQHQQVYHHVQVSFRGEVCLSQCHSHRLQDKVG